VFLERSNSCAPLVPLTTVALTPALAWLICAATPARLLPAATLIVTGAPLPAVKALPPLPSSAQVPNCSVSVPSPSVLPVGTAVLVAICACASWLTSTESVVTAAALLAVALTALALDEVTVRAFQVEDCASFAAASPSEANSD